MMPWYSRQIESPYYFLVFGVIFFIAAVVSTWHRKNVWTVWSWFGLSRQGTD